MEAYCLIFKKQGDYNSCLLLELKRKNGQASQRQRAWAKFLNLKVADSVEMAIEIINKWGE